MGEWGTVCTGATGREGAATKAMIIGDREVFCARQRCTSQARALPFSAAGWRAGARVLSRANRVPGATRCVCVNVKGGAGVNSGRRVSFNHPPFAFALRCTARKTTVKTITRTRTPSPTLPSSTPLAADKKEKGKSTTPKTSPHQLMLGRPPHPHPSRRSPARWTRPGRCLAGPRNTVPHRAGRIR